MEHKVQKQKNTSQKEKYYESEDINMKKCKSSYSNNVVKEKDVGGFKILKM